MLDPSKVLGVLSVSDPVVLPGLSIVSAPGDEDRLSLDSLDPNLGGPPLIGIMLIVVKDICVPPPVVGCEVPLGIVLMGVEIDVGASLLVSGFDEAKLGRLATGD